MATPEVLAGMVMQMNAAHGLSAAWLERVFARCQREAREPTIIHTVDPGFAEFRRQRAEPMAWYLDQLGDA